MNPVQKWGLENPVTVWVIIIAGVFLLLWVTDIISLPRLRIRAALSALWTGIIGGLKRVFIIVGAIVAILLLWIFWKDVMWLWNWLNSGAILYMFLTIILVFVIYQYWDEIKNWVSRLNAPTLPGVPRPNKTLWKWAGITFGVFAAWLLMFIFSGWITSTFGRFYFYSAEPWSPAIAVAFWLTVLALLFLIGWLIRKGYWTALAAVAGVIVAFGAVCAAADTWNKLDKSIQFIAAEAPGKAFVEAMRGAWYSLGDTTQAIVSGAATSMDAVHQHLKDLATAAHKKGLTERLSDAWWFWGEPGMTFPLFLTWLLIFAAIGGIMWLLRKRLEWLIAWMILIALIAWGVTTIRRHAPAHSGITVIHHKEVTDSKTVKVKEKEPIGTTSIEVKPGEKVSVKMKDWRAVRIEGMEGKPVLVEVPGIVENVPLIQGKPLKLRFTEDNEEFLRNAIWKFSIPPGKDYTVMVRFEDIR